MTYGSLWQRWSRGVSWTWINDRYRCFLPEDFDVSVMTLESHDRFHAKQGRSTARFVFDPDAPDAAPAASTMQLTTNNDQLTSKNGPLLAVYLKRHFRLPWTSRMAALLDPAGRHSPAAAEWVHLERARALGIAVPDVVATGERIGPGPNLSSFLMLAELTGSEAINELLPRLPGRLDPGELSTLKRRAITEMARITATLHNALVFHKDLYLCHFFLDRRSFEHDPARPHITLIDLHRLAKHRLWAFWWRSKDLGQLLFSTYGLAGITKRDRLRFWAVYRRLAGIRWPWWHALLIRCRAARYMAHNRKPR